MRKYISQIDSSGFVYPNNPLSEYDIDIIHDVNDNSVSGTISNLSTTPNGSNFDFTFDYTWNLNGAEPFVRKDGVLSVLTVHLMVGTLYLKPWRVVGDVSAPTGTTTFSGTFTTTVTPAQLGVSSFSSGDVHFDIRFIGHRAIFSACGKSTLTYPPPTPTPTASIPLTPTRTPTPTPTPTIATPSCGTTFIGEYSLNNYHLYPDRNVFISPTTTQVFFNYSAIGRPNRFTVYDAQGNFLGTSGWVGIANYPGPWGMSLNVPETGSFSVNVNNQTLLILRVEAGNGSVSDTWSVGIGCIP